MIDVSTADAVFGTGGAAAVFLLLKMFAKQGFGGLLDVKEMGARNDILEDLRTEVKDLRAEVKTMKAEVKEMQIDISKLTDRLVTVRGHALVAYSIVQTHCMECPQAQKLLNAITEIIKED